MQKKTKKRFLAAVLAVAMAMSQLVPLTAFADDSSEITTSYVGDAASESTETPTPSPTASSDATKADEDAPKEEAKDDADSSAAASSTETKDESEASSEASSQSTDSTSDTTATPVPSEEPSTVTEPEEVTEPTEEEITEATNEIVAPIVSSPANAPAPLATGTEPAIMDAATMANIRAGGTTYGNVTFARGEGQENTIVIKVNENTRTYGEEYVNPGLTVTLNGTEQSEADVLKALNEGILTMYATAEQDVRTGAGNYDVYVTINLNNVTINETNYTILAGTTQLSKIHVSTRPIDVYANEGYQNHGMDQPQLTYHAEGLINGDQLSGSLHANTDKNSPVGDYDIDIGSLSNPNYTITFHPAKLHVVENTVIVTPMIKDGDYNQAEFSREYGKANPEFTWHVTGLTTSDQEKLDAGSITIEELLGGTPVVSTDADVDSAPGDYTVSVKINDKNAGANGNYNFVCNNATLHVTRRKVTATVTSQEKTYGAKDPSALTFFTWGDGSVVERGSDGNPLSDANALGVQKSLARIAVSAVREPGEDVGTYGWNFQVTDVNTQQYYDITFNNGTLTINQATLTVHVADVTSIYGEARQGALKTDVGDNGVEGFVNGDSYSSVFGETQPSYTAISKDGQNYNGFDKKAPVGEYTLTAMFEPQHNYKFEYLPGTLTITQRPLHIIVTPGQHKTYGEMDASFAVQYTDMGKVEGDFANCVVTREPGENVGTYAYTIEQFEASDDFKNYDVTLVAEDAFEIVKKDLTVIIPDAEKLYGDENPNVMDGVTYDGFVTNAELGIADTADNALTGKLVLTHEAVRTSPVGEYKITASGLESQNYNIIYKGQTSGTQGILTVKPLPIIIEGNTLTRKYNVLDATKTPGYTIWNSSKSAIVAVVDPEGSPLNITATCPEWSDVTAAKGSYPIKITYEPNANYDIQVIDGTCVITDGDVTLIPDSKTFVYGDFVTEDMIRELTVTGVSAVDGTKAYHNGDLITNVGYVSISITKDGEPVTSNSRATLDVGNYDITTSITPLPGKEDSYTVDIDAGANRLLITRRPVTFTVTPGQQKTFGDPDPVFSVADPDFGTWTGGNNIADPRADLADAVLSRVPGENVGRYAFTRGTLDEQPMSKNYNITLVNNSFEIVARKVTGTIQDVTKTYGDVFDASGYKVVWDGFLDMDDQNAMNGSLVFTCVGAAETANVGQYAIGATYARNNNYEVTLVNGTMNVVAREITLTFKDAEKEYGDADPSLDSLYTVEGNLANTGVDVLTLTTGKLSGSVTREEGEDVGEYAIQADLYNKNYDLTYVTSTNEELKADGTKMDVATLTINPAVLTIAVNGPYTMTYGDPLPDFAVTYSGFKRGENASTALTGELKFVDLETGEPIPERPSVGTYTIHATGLDNVAAPNYTIKWVDSTLTVNARAITVRPDDATKVYGEDDPELTYTVVDGARYVLEGTDLVDLHVEREAGEDVGTYEMTVVGEDSNFIITKEPADFTITPRTLTVSMAEDISRVYGDENPVLSIEDLVFEGFASNDNLDIHDDQYNALTDAALSFIFTDAEGAPATTHSHVGTGTVIATGLANVGAGNYDIQYVEGVFTITKRPITVTAVDQTGLYGNSVNIDWTDYETVDEVTYTGDDSKPAVMDWDTLTGTHLCVVTDHTPVGDYDIIPVFAADANSDYEITVVNGTFTVVERMIQVNVTVPSDAVYGEVENPDITVSAEMLDAEQSDGTHGAVVSPDLLGLDMTIDYEPFDDTSDAVEADGEITPDIAVDPDHEDGSVFTTTNVKNAGRYTFDVTVNMDEETAANYGNDVQVYFVDESGETISAVPVMTISRASVKTSMPDMEKLYGTETVLPELTYEGILEGEEPHHFDILDDEGNVITPEVSVIEEVAGKMGDVGEYEDAFSFGGVDGLDYGNYHYEPCTSKLTITRLILEDVLNDLEEAGKPGIILTAQTSTSDGEAVSVEDEFTTSWAISDITVTPPEGYLISTSDSLGDENVWGKTMTISMTGAGVENEFYLMDAETGAITTVGSKTVNIDKSLPVVTAVDVSGEYGADNAVDVFNTEFKKFTSEVKIWLTGEEIEERKPVDDEQDAVDGEQGVAVDDGVEALAEGDEEETSNVADSVNALSTCEADPNSGVKGLECYTISKGDAKFDDAGNLIVDASKFQPVELTYTDPNTAYASINVTPDFEGYIVTRTQDVAGQYSAAAVASVSVIAPKAPQPSNDNSEPEEKKEEYVAPTFIRQSQTGVNVLQFVPLVIVIGVAIFMVVMNKKNGGKKK